MALRYRRQWLSLLTLLGVVAGVGWAVAQPDRSAGSSGDPITLAPKNSLLLLSTTGTLKNLEAWKKTAAYQAIEESGLSALGTKVIDFVHQLAGQQGGGAFVSIGRELLGHVQGNGVTFAVTVEPPQAGPPTGYAILVLHQAGSFEAKIAPFVIGMAGEQLEFEQSVKKGRNVTSTLIPEGPGIEIGWWQEQGHLVIVAGVQAVDSAIAVASGEAPNATAHPLYTKYFNRDFDFAVDTTGWLDVASIRGLVSEIPLPIETHPRAGGPLTVGKVIDIAGLSNLNALVSVSGFKGPAIWTESWVDAPGPRKGLLAMADGAPITLAELPPMASGLNAFSATRFSATRLYDEVLGAVRQLAQYAPSDEAPQDIDDFLREAREELGIDVRRDLLAHVDDRLCGYNDSQQGLLNMGAGFLIKLKDPVRFKVSVEKVLARIESKSNGEIAARKYVKHGREVTSVEFHPSPFGWTYVIEGDWLVLGTPQVIETYLMRVDGKLPKWTPDPAQQAAFDAMPKSFSAVTLTDSKAFINLLAGLAPVGIGFAELGLKSSGEFPEGLEFPIRQEDFPPAELITRPLFPNLAVVEVTEEGIHSRGRASLPGLPFTGSGDAVTTTAVVAVGVALILPAVQQVRIAARRSQSMDHMHNITIALHSHEGVYNEFPAGTVPNASLKPEERLSWMVSLLPFLEQKALFDRIDRKQGWKQSSNLELAGVVLELLTNPGVTDDGPTTYSDEGEWLGTTHYVGLGGLGEDGPTLPASHKRAGAFAYDQPRRIRDFLDGTSNTIMISEASGSYGGWMQGGHATVRPLTTQPYINGSDGIGGPFPGGVQMGLVDGSVRFVSEHVDPTVLEGMVTINGGEVVSFP